MEVVVALAVAHVGGQRLGQLFGLVARDQINDVVGDQGREPAHVLARRCHIVRDPDRGGAHHPDLCKVTPSFFGARAHEAQAPLDKVWVGKLEDHPIGDASGAAKRLGAVAGDPDRRHTRIGPRYAERLSLVGDLLAAGQVPDQMNRLFEPFYCRWFLAHHAP